MIEQLRTRLDGEVLLYVKDYLALSTRKIEPAILSGLLGRLVIASGLLGAVATGGADHILHPNLPSKSTVRAPSPSGTGEEIIARIAYPICSP